MEGCEFPLLPTRLWHNSDKERRTPALCRPHLGGALAHRMVRASPISSQPRPARALTRVLSASLACNARFQIFRAELASSSSSRQHRVQLTFLRPLPILQLVKGISSQTVRRGALWPGRSWKRGAEACMVCRTVSAPLGRVPGIMCPRPAQAPPPRPALPMGAAHRVIFSLPYCIWPGDSKPDRRLQPRQLRRQRRRQQAGVSRCSETWPGAALSHWDKEYFLAGWAVPSPGGVLALGGGGGHAGNGWGASGCYFVQVLSWSDKLFCPQKLLWKTCCRTGTSGARHRGKSVLEPW